MTLRSLACASVLALFAAACVPHRDLPPAQIEKLDKLEDVMDVQATVADPQFKKIGEAKFSDEDWAAFADMSNRLSVTSRKIQQFSKGPDFDRLADQLHRYAGQLGTVASVKDVDGTNEALANIKSTCKECHSKFK